MTWFIVVLAVSLAQGAGDKAKVHSFAKADLGKLPASWKTTQTNKGDGASIWKVVADDKAPSKTGFALAQTAAGPKQVFNLCIIEDSSFKDGEISVHFKANQGKIDQGGGIVWRYQDANNYYIARMNPLEDNYRVYKVIKGKRIQLQTTIAQIVVPSGEWHKLTIRHAGDKIECFLDGKKLLDAKDNEIAAAGKIGLWTKADAQTSFDNLSVQAISTKKN